MRNSLRLRPEESERRSSAISHRSADHRKRVPRNLSPPAKVSSRAPGTSTYRGDQQEQFRNRGRRIRMRSKSDMSETAEIVVPEPVSGRIAELVREMLVQLGENPDREGLRRTPERFEKALRFLTSGYRQDPDKLLNGAMFNVCYDEMVVVKDIELYSLCEHHLLPFFGKC